MLHNILWSRHTKTELSHRLYSPGDCLGSFCGWPELSIALQALLVSCLWQFGATLENFQVAVIRKEPMSLLAGRLANHAELDHVLGGLCHSGRRESCSAVTGAIASTSKRTKNSSKICDCS